MHYGYFTQYKFVYPLILVVTDSPFFNGSVSDVLYVELLLSLSYSKLINTSSEYLETKLWNRMTYLRNTFGFLVAGLSVMM